MSRALRPEEVADHKAILIPAGVIDAFNDAIAMNFVNGNAHVIQNQVVDMIAKNMGCARSEVFKNKWLDVEPVFEAAGWRVSYDKPGYNEDYEASFTFKKRR